VIGYDRWANPKGVHKHQAYTDKPKVENWPVPKTKPFITPIDRLKIIQSRSLDNLQPSTSSATPEFLKDPNDLELNISRARSSKVLGKNIRRVEHRPTWLSKWAPGYRNELTVYILVTHLFLGVIFMTIFITSLCFHLYLYLYFNLFCILKCM